MEGNFWEDKKLALDFILDDGDKAVDA